MNGYTQPGFKCRAIRLQTLSAYYYSTQPHFEIDSRAESDLSQLPILPLYFKERERWAKKCPFA